jgi:hypothetical protein
MIGADRPGWRFDAADRDPQLPAAAAVVICTVLRPSLHAAIKSVYAQNLKGGIQILIGVDKPLEPVEPLLELLRARPPHVSALVLDPGYSTSARHGGVHPAHDGGSLRTALSFLANSRRITYLDDDNTWLPNHLSSLARALKGVNWAYSLRMFVDGATGKDLCVDVWDSVGPGKGIRVKSLGGFVDVNCMMIDKLRAGGVLYHWSHPMAGSQTKVTADRRVFKLLQTRHACAGTGLATVRYAIRSKFFLWPHIKKQLDQARPQAAQGRPQAGAAASAAARKSP